MLLSLIVDSRAWLSDVLATFMAPQIDINTFLRLLTGLFFFVLRYQKTAGALGAVGEKTGAIFGGIGAKFGQLKETPTFKSFEERVGGVYTAARVGHSKHFYCSSASGISLLGKRIQS